MGLSFSLEASGSRVQSAEGGEQQQEEPPPPEQQIVTITHPFVYSMHEGGWVMRPDLTSMPAAPAAPFAPWRAPISLCVKQASPIRSPVALHRDTLQLLAVRESASASQVEPLQEPQQPQQRRLRFIFDTETAVTIKVFFAAEEHLSEEDGVPTYKAPVYAITGHGAGRHQVYDCPVDVDIRKIGREALTFRETRPDRFPVVVELMPERPLPQDCPDALYAYGTVPQGVASGPGAWPVRCIYQRARCGAQIIEMKEIYGLEERDAAPSEDAAARECVICLTEPRAVAVLPCRHLCLCTSCAPQFKYTQYRCPVCREGIVGLLQLKVEEPTAGATPT